MVELSYIVNHILHAYIISEFGPRLRPIKRLEYIGSVTIFMVGHEGMPGMLEAIYMKCK